MLQFITGICKLMVSNWLFTGTCAGFIGSSKSQTLQLYSTAELYLSYCQSSTLARTAKCYICSITNLAAVVQAPSGCVSSYLLQVGEHHSDGMRLSAHLHL